MPSCYTQADVGIGSELSGSYALIACLPFHMGNTESPQNRHIGQNRENEEKIKSNMFDTIDNSAFINDQGKRSAKLFAAVVLAALDDAIADDKKYGNGVESIARWARSRDGSEVLMCAGIEPTERCVKGMMEFVSRGVRTSVALSREESERQAAAKEAA